MNRIEQLVELPEREVRIRRNKIMGVLRINNIPYNSVPTVFPENTEPVICSRPVYEILSSSSNTRLDQDPIGSLILSAKSSLGEAVMNYVTGFVTWRQWIDSAPKETQSNIFVKSFLEHTTQALYSKERGFKTPTHAAKYLMSLLGYEYMRPLVTRNTLYDQENEKNLLRILTMTHQQNLPNPRDFVFQNLMPLELLDYVFAEYVAQQYARGSFYLEYGDRVSGTLEGLYEIDTGRHYAQPARDNHTKAQQKRIEIAKTHEVLHGLSTSDNHSIDPLMWLGKSGLQLYVNGDLY